MKTIYFLAIIMLPAIVSCSKETTTEKEGVVLRIENLTSAKLDSVVVINPAGRQVYYDISAGLKTDYKAFDYIYNYAYIKAYYNNTTAIMQPIDYVGETKIENGKYTYRLSIISNAVSNYVNVQNQKD